MIQYTNCPLIPEKILFAQWHTNPLTNKRSLRRSKAEIHWLHQTESQISVYWKGRVLHEGLTLCDFYGFATSLGAVVDAEKEVATLEAEAPLEVRVKTIYSVEPVKVLPPELHGSNRTPYEYIEGNFFAGDDAVFDRIETFDWNVDRAEGEWTPSDAALQKKTIADYVSWSSLDPRSEEKVRADFLARYPIPGAVSTQEQP